MIELLDELRIRRMVLGEDLAVRKNAVAGQVDEPFPIEPHLSPDDCSLSPLPSALRRKNRDSNQESNCSQRRAKRGRACPYTPGPKIRSRELSSQENSTDAQQARS